MGKFSGILICTDLDGTLFRGDKTISGENKRAIEYFMSEGGYFTFVTGRMPYYSRSAYEAVGPNVPFGCINGGGIYDGAEKKYVKACTLPRDVVELVAYVDEHFPEVGIQMCAHERTFFSKENGVMKTFRQITGVPNLVCPYREVTEPVGKVLFGTDSEQEMQALAKALKEHPRATEFDFIRSERTLFEILPKGVNKGLAITGLAEHLGVDIGKTVAVGDYDNDVGMFRAARLGIAVANASPAAMAAADLVTVSNEEHAIAKIIYDLESGAIRL